MSEWRPVKIAGLGNYLPSKVIHSEELDARLGFPIGFIERKTGVVERRMVDGETTLDMGVAAARRALDNAGVAASAIDVLIVAQSVPAQAIPCTAALLQRAMGLSGMPCVDINATCLSFLTALDLVGHAMANGAYRCALIVSSEVASRGLDWQHWESSALFGDAAAAAVVVATPAGEDSAILTSRMETYSEGAEFTRLRGGGTLYPADGLAQDPTLYLFHMDGPRVFRLASSYMGGFLERLHAPLALQDRTCDLLIPHQASMFPIRQLTARYGYAEDRVFINLPNRGNCVAASLPLALCEAVESGRAQRGSRLTLIGSGAGLSLAGMLLIY